MEEFVDRPRLTDREKEHIAQSLEEKGWSQERLIELGLRDEPLGEKLARKWGGA